ncbi:hypothetical protein BHE74_00041514 [Ensete ventricosum]|nr:hypothetical protein BHE74_00041514 [Ensete ventricosum]
MHCNTEEECSELVRMLPPSEAALLDWAINLMADVVEHEHCNKMNARNIAMVFAPNMTQMADPLTALIHAVQVMNFLKTLILKMLREREEATFAVRALDSFTISKILPDTEQSLGRDEEKKSEIGEENDLVSEKISPVLRKLCRHPVLQLSRSTKKAAELNAVNSEGREAWA